MKHSEVKTSIQLRRIVYLLSHLPQMGKDASLALKASPSSVFYTAFGFPQCHIQNVLPVPGQVLPIRESFLVIPVSHIIWETFNTKSQKHEMLPPRPCSQMAKCSRLNYEVLPGRDCDSHSFVTKTPYVYEN